MKIEVALTITWPIALRGLAKHGKCVKNEKQNKNRSCVFHGAKVVSQHEQGQSPEDRFLVLY